MCVCVLGGGGGGGGVHLATSMHYNHVIALFPGLLSRNDNIGGRKERIS